MRSTVAYITLLFILLSCSEELSPNDTVEEDTLKEIEIGDFVIQFPQSFNLIKEQGIDSYVGRISNGKIDFHFDYGYYSNSFDKSIGEYLSQEVWKWNVLDQYKLLLPGTELTAIAKETTLITSQTDDSVNYTNLYLFKNDTLSYELIIPEEIREANIIMDTVKNVAYKFVRKGNYVGLYARNLSEFNNSIGSYLSLSIVASDLNQEETEMAFSILRSCRLL